MDGVEEERILVVDDDEALLRTIEKLLTKEGYAVTVVDNGSDALEKISENVFDLVILDIKMPEMDGITLLGKIRGTSTKERLTNVIMMTAYASEDAPIKALKLGAENYIIKPFELDEFLQCVNRNMNLSRLRKERDRYVAELEEATKQLEKAKNRYRDLTTSLSRVVFTKTGSRKLEKRIQEILEEYRDAEPRD